MRFSTPVSRSGSLSTFSEAEPPQSSSTSRQDGTAELLRALLPALTQDPATYEESVSSICAAHNIDPSVVSAIKRAVKRDPQSRPLERCVHRGASAFYMGVLTHCFQSQRTLDLPTTSLHNPKPSDTIPIKQDRPFPSGSPGVTTWYSSYSLDTINTPPSDLNPGVGDLYIHTNRAEDFHHIWLFGLDRSWGKVTASDKVYHPVIADRVLSMRANGTPSWITAASYTTIKGRKEKARASE